MRTTGWPEAAALIIERESGPKSEGELPLFRQVPKEVLFRPVFALDIGGDVEKGLKMAPDMRGLERSDFHCR